MRRLIEWINLLIFLGVLVSFYIFQPKINAFLNRLFPISQKQLTVEEEIQPQLQIYSYNQVRDIAEDLSKESSSYRIQTTYFNYYSPIGNFLASDGTILWEPGSVVPTDNTTAIGNFASNKNQLYTYLMGIRKKSYDYGYHSRMRVTPNDNTSVRYPESKDITLAIDEDKYHQLYELFYLNGITGGCIIQDLDNGEISVMTAKSVDTSLQEDGLAPLQPCISVPWLTDVVSSAQDKAEIQDFLELQTNRTTVNFYKKATNDEDGKNSENMQKISESVYTFRTDFDLIKESPVTEDYQISPLHLNAITQRIFSQKKCVPTVLYQSDLNKNCAIYQKPETDVNTLKTLQNLYEEKDFQEHGVTIRYHQGNSGGMYYVTGVLSNEKKEYAFTLYGRDSLVFRYLESLSIIYGKNQSEIQKED